jgi:hypothetical protein
MQLLKIFAADHREGNIAFDARQPAQLQKKNA